MRSDAACIDGYRRSRLINAAATTLAIGTALLLPAASSALAQPTYPAKPVRWIVPYAAGGGTDLLARAITDVVGGHIEVYFGAIISTLPQVKNARLRALDVTSLNRVAAAPELPTLDEQGLKRFETVSWVIVSAPAGTAHDIIARIHRDAVHALTRPDVRARLAADGAELVGNTPQEVTAYLKAEVDKWGTAVRGSGAKPEG